MASPGPDTVADEVADLEARVRSRLLGRVGAFRIVPTGAGLVLRGYARTYYCKQLAQQAVLGATRLPILANEIDVS